MQNPQQPSQDDPNAIGATEIIVPLGLSVFCGIGGFVWGLVRLAQGHKKPGWVAVGINAGTMFIGFLAFVTLVGIGASKADESLAAAESLADEGSGTAGSGRAEPESEPEAAPSEPPIEATAREIFSDYQDNEVRANAKYKDRGVLVTGKVSGIDADLMDDPVLKLATSNQFMDVSLHGIPASAAGALDKGETVSALCTEVSEVASMPQLRDCTLQ
ncbi:MAG: OB-fold protein [Myxococcota bacterium]